VPLVGTGHPEGSKCIEFAFFVSDFAWWFCWVRLGQRKSESGRVRREVDTLKRNVKWITKERKKEVAHSGIALLWLARLAGENDEPLLVGFQPLHVDEFPFLAKIPPPVIHHNAYALGLLPVDSCGFEFREGESSTFAQLPVVTDSLATNGRS
jgi:hypothetical protein